MKKKINLFLITIGAVTILITMALSVFVFYNSFKNEIFDNLKTYEDVIESPTVLENIRTGSYNPDDAGVRVTIIASDGTVTYDSFTDASDLENHSDRPEIIQAVKDGSGYMVRKSETMNSSIFYYAERLDDGSIIRVAKETTSMFRIVWNMIPAMIVIAIVIFGICTGVSALLVRSFLKPIRDLADNMDNTYRKTSYRELIPFIDRINHQHYEIIKGARLREEFTANVSHELKTPLTSISGYAELIENGMTNEKDVNRFAGEIRRNASRLLSIINDIIKLSELDSSELKISMEEYDVYEVIKLLVANMQMNAKLSDVNLTFSGEHVMLRTNRFMLEELINNLCDNAIRYNVKNGNVNIDVRKIDGKTVITVKDTGIGISKDDRERIFERFYRVDKSRSKATGGTGLGLAIVKHIAMQLGAELELTSEIGKGTQIRVIF